MEKHEAETKNVVVRGRTIQTAHEANSPLNAVSRAYVVSVARLTIRLASAVRENSRYCANLFGKSTACLQLIQIFKLV